MSEASGRDRHVPRPDRDPRGGYGPSGRERQDREPYDQGPHDQGPYDRGPHDRGEDAGRETRARNRSHDRAEERAEDRARDPREPREAETRRGGQGTRDRGPEVPEGAEPAPEGLQDRVVELQALVTDLQDRWRRALADLDNLRKRVSRDAVRTQAEERARAAAEWLPVLDNLDRALEHAETDPASIAEGMRAIRGQAQEVLSRLGYARRDDTGTVFDPARHEAVGVLSQEGVPDGTIVRVVRPGYGDGEQQLRPALVVVAKGE
ncbi:hypothetical protein GCM10022252_47520 [Streptosporangium oxazolinicum]|uniref:Protein GrpE n=1 Tax=Streptosporangium oxazolinicum TaxID=909287 RepID=A0ABP8B4K3_9ACTN